MAMASSPSQIDHLSALPDEVLIIILSLLPTRRAARTSVLSPRFRHLWKASSSVDLSFAYCSSFKHSTYVSMANIALLSRTPSNPLLSLDLKIGSPLSCDLTDLQAFISSLLVHAHALGLRHLTIDGFSDFPSVFSISSLDSLSIRINSTFPSKIAFTHLRCLSINLTTKTSTQIQRLLSELCCLEDLQLHVFAEIEIVCLSSRTIKKLELFFDYIDIDSLGLSMPSLEFICLVYQCHYGCRNIPLIHGEIPFIRKAVVTINCLRQEHITAVVQLLNFISHVEELSLDLEEYGFSGYPFSVLMEPGKEMPTFPNLKHLDMSICFHEFNFDAVVTILHHCPTLESLILHHKPPDMYAVEWGKRYAWRSMLPRNRDELQANILLIHQELNAKENK
ncbi:F-box/LRR-repeat protein [Carex littledalei]|uniref:F-box/LRR-repeat protein n=1 Tax=Carex littledalei TaxID=544730 RepID=A0A833QHM5_9POAL|nr:F-box/LRR-repeat protein [Carex littledalei]